MRASLLMKAPPVMCAPTTSVSAVCQMMGERRVGCVVVVRGGEVIGIVTDRDIALRVVARGLSGDVAVDTVMTRNVVKLTVDADVVTAEATMRAGTCAACRSSMPTVASTGSSASTTSSASSAVRPTASPTSLRTRRGAHRDRRGRRSDRAAGRP